MVELTAQTIDRFQVAACLSDERWGSAWKAYDPKFDRTVVLLALDPAWIGSQSDYVANTARITLRFKHPGVARLLDMGVAGGIQYLVREYITGDNLSSVLKARREQNILLPIPEAVQIIIEICRALNYIHTRSLVHGNLSSAAVMFKDEAAEELVYQPVLIDLGLIDPEHPEDVPPSRYRAPEIETAQRITPAADIFAAGVILYELLTGVSPDGTPFARPAALRPAIPNGIEKLLRKALAPDPANRFADAGRMAAALESVLPVLKASLAGKNDGAAVEEGGSRVETLLPALLAAWQDPIYAPLAPSPAPAHSLSDTQPANPPIDLSQDQVHIRETGKEVRSINLRPGAIIIGRSLSNDIVIDAAGISRRHARIEFDGKDYRITDINSTNGTYLEEKALTPNEPTIWPAGGSIRIGEVWLRLERAGQSQTTRAFIADTTRPAKNLPETVAVVTGSTGRSFDVNQLVLSSDGLIGAYVENPNLVVKPGSSISLPVILFNRSAAADTYNITYEGLPVSWMTNMFNTISIPANSDRELSLTLRPPRTSAGRAGRHQLTIRIASLRAPDQSVELRLSTTVTAFSEFFSELQTSRIRSGQVGQVLIHNRGNLPETFMVLWEDRLRELVIDPPQVRVTIPPDKQVAVEYRLQAFQPRWFGSETTHPYKVHVSAQTGEMQTHSGEYIAKALIPAWAPVALMMVCVGLFCLVVLLANEITAPAFAGHQTKDSSTSTMIAATSNVQAMTLTADAANQILAATQLVVTQTAYADLADTDGDHLSNGQENLYGTAANNPDTDNDHLNDGDEVLTYRTNPLVPDSDGDLVKDGDEVRRGTDPLKKDTDGDGVEDGFDPDPLRYPTATIVLIPTFTRTPTPTATPIVLFGDLSISITNGRDVSTPGQSSSYTITATNRSQVELRDAAITAALPPGLVNASWVCAASLFSNCSTTNGIGNINARVSLIANGTAIITLNGTVGPDAGNQLSVTANVAPPPGITDTNPVDNQAVDLDSLAPRISLSLTNTDNLGSIRGGEATTYIITVSNSGPSPVNGVSLVDPFPAELANVTWTCSASPGSSCSVPGPASGNLNTLLNLAGQGTATITANATVSLTASGTIFNTASITSPIDPLANNKSVTDVTQIEPQADLSIDVSSPVTVTVNSFLTYTLSITNTGPAAVSGFELVTQIPAGAAFITSTLASPVAPPVCNPALGQVSCTLGPLPAGGAIQMEFVVQTPPTAGQLDTSWDILAPEPDPNAVNNSSESTVLVY